MIYCGDALKVLKSLPDRSVNCCVTSPPYWGLRDYGMDGQIGLEQSIHEHIDKLVSTYQFRKEEERYARRVTMEEIADNGYNLNISRYISTAVAEEAIDLKVVNAEMVALEQKIADAANKHNEFLKELGLPPLP